jgi:hypothetical protein
LLPAFSRLLCGGTTACIFVVSDASDPDVSIDEIEYISSSSMSVPPPIIHFVVGIFAQDSASTSLYMGDASGNNHCDCSRR